LHHDDEIGPHPNDASTHLRRDLLDESMADAQRLEPSTQAERHVVGEAAAYPARVDQAPILVNDEHPAAVPGVLFLFLMGEADDHEFLAVLALRFDPLRAASGAITALALLGDHALEPELRGVPEYFVAGGLDVVGEADGAHANATLDQR